MFFSVLCFVACAQDRQARSATLSGTVYNLAWQPIGGAEVQLTNLNTCSTVVVATDENGLYTFAHPGRGDFRINVARAGFNPIATVAFKVITDDGQSRKHFLQPATQVPLQVTDSCPEAPLHGNRVQSASLRKRVPPDYPDSLRALGISGEVVLEAVLDKQGRISTLRFVSSPHSELTEAAEHAVQQWLYNPTRLDGKPVDVVFPITVRFAR